MNKGKTILVTGGAGYIGSHTVVELMHAGYSVVILDNFSNTSKEVYASLLSLLPSEPILFEGSVLDYNLLDLIFKAHKIDAVIHFAAFKAVGESVENPLMYYENNITGLIRLLAMMEENEVKKLVFSSSCTVYGIPENEICVSETTPLGTPNSPYGQTKQMGEQIIQDFCKSNDIEAVLLRYFNPVGAHESAKIGELPNGVPNNILPFITQTAFGEREELKVFGNDYDTADGTCVRDFIHVVDVAEAHVKAIEVEQKSENPLILNLGTGKGSSVLELISSFEEANGIKINWSFADRRPGDVPAIYANPEKAEKILNWKTKRTITDAVRDAWNWEKYRMENEMD
ncbi:MAG: UDP-glucose 4-epimerase GalE [Fluviicola sp.]